jgi:hypothetical protein
MQAHREADLLARWKAFGPVAETAREAAKRAEEDFLRLRLAYHLGDKCAQN